MGDSVTTWNWPSDAAITKSLVRAECYPIDWAEIAELVKSANGYVCQACGVECRQVPNDATKPVLTVAHVDQVYDADWVLLAPLCSVCHMRHDAAFGWAARRRHERVRMRLLGQLEFRVEGRPL